jgi:predicted transcriptional regulator YheO
MKKITSQTAALKNEKGRAFREFCTNMEKSESCKKKSLDEFMILPIQRITRYHLLLKRLKEFTDKNSTTFDKYVKLSIF